MHLFAPRLVASLFLCGSIFQENANDVIPNDNESKRIFWVVFTRFPEGDRELRKPCSNSVTVKLWHKHLFIRFCWVIQRETESHFLHVNFFKRSARHVFLEEMFAAVYAKYYNIQTLTSFVFPLLSHLIQRRPLPLPLGLITVSQK